MPGGGRAHGLGFVVSGLGLRVSGVIRAEAKSGFQGKCLAKPRMKALPLPPAPRSRIRISAHQVFPHS